MASTPSIYGTYCISEVHCPPDAHSPTQGGDVLVADGQRLLLLLQLVLGGDQRAEGLVGRRLHLDGGGEGRISQKENQPVACT